MGTIDVDTEGSVPLREEEEVPEVQPASQEPAHDNYHIIDHFRSCQDKSRLLAGFLQFSTPCFGTVIVFSVQPKQMRYLVGHGTALQADHILQAPIPWMNGTLVRRIVMQRMPYQGPIPMDVEEKQMFAQFLQLLPSCCWLYPMAIGDVVDCLIYADSPKIAPRMATQRLEFVIGKMVLALRRLLVEHLLVQG